MRNLYALALGFTFFAYASGADQFQSYRPYPYVFLHGRSADANQWGLQCEENYDFAGTLHANKDGFPKEVPTCLMAHKMFDLKGYGERLFREHFWPRECDKGYIANSTDPAGPIAPPGEGRVRYPEWKGGISKTCANDEFYVDFQQINPDAKESDILALPSVDNPDDFLSISDGSFGPDLKNAKNRLFEVSFNHSFIEAYNGDGNIDPPGPQDREVLSDRWGKTTLVDIARLRIKQVLDEYYKDDTGKPNWPCNPAKKVVLVSYSTGTAVAGGVIYADQELKKNEPVETWCRDGKPAVMDANGRPKARDLLSGHIAYVVGHNPVVAGSDFGSSEPRGKLLMAISLGPFAGATSYLIATEFTGGVYPGLMKVSTGLATLTSAGLLTAQWALSRDRLADDLGAGSDYFRRLRGYGVPPTNILTGELIKYKTVATYNWAWPHEIDVALGAYLAFTAVREFPYFGGRVDRFAASLVGLVGFTAWNYWNNGTDFVLDRDEDRTSGKALNKDALIEHHQVHGAAHATIAPVFAPSCYPYNQKVQDALRPLLLERPTVHGQKLTSHKCINHAGDDLFACKDLKNQVTITPSYPIDRTKFLDQLRTWPDGAGNPTQQPPDLDVSNRNPADVLFFTDAGGSPLDYELYYNSNLMATDKVEGYLNGQYFPLKFRKEYGAETEASTHSALVRIPLTKVRFPMTSADGQQRNPVWGEFQSILQDGGSIVGFRGTNDAGSILDKRIIYYDKRTLLASVNTQIKDASGNPFASQPRSLNLDIFPFREGNEDGGAPEIGNKGILFAFRTDQVPQFSNTDLTHMAVDVYGTRPDGQVERTSKRTYTLDGAHLPALSPIYDPYSSGAAAGKIYLTRRINEGTGTLQPHQLFFWIKPEDLKQNSNGRDGSGNPAPTIEGVKHATVLFTKPPVGGTGEGNKVFYQLEFGIDNTPPGPVRVFSPTLVKSIGGKSYADKDGDGDLANDMGGCDDQYKDFCDPGVDGTDNNRNGHTDELEELPDIKVYSQNKNEKGERINQGVHFRISVADNMQDAAPYSKSMRWQLIGPHGEVKCNTTAAYDWGRIYNGFCPFQDGDVWADGLWSVKLDVSDLAGNAFSGTVTNFVIDNTPPNVEVVGDGSRIWQGNASSAAGRSLSLLLQDAYSSTFVKTDEYTELKVRLIPQMSMMGSFVVQNTISPVLAASPNDPPPAGNMVLIYDNVEFLQLNGFTNDNLENFYKKLPDGKYQIEATAVDRIGNRVRVPALETHSFDFIVDRTPPAVPSLSVTPFLVPAGQQATLSFQVDQSLDALSNRTGIFQYQASIDGRALIPSTQGEFDGNTAHLQVPLSASMLSALSEGPHRIQLQLSDKDSQGIRNTATVGTTFVFGSWGISITQPRDLQTLSGTIPIQGRAGDPFVQDQSPFAGFRLSYVPGLFTDPASLPPLQASGLLALGSNDNVGHFEAVHPDNLGTWDTRRATQSLQGKKGDFTLVLEAYQEDGQRKIGLARVHLDNSGSAPAPTTTLDFTGYSVPNASFQLIGKPSQVFLTVLDAGGNLVNKKSTVAAPMDWDDAYMPVANSSVAGVSGDRFLIRFRPGEDAVVMQNNKVFAFLLKGFNGLQADIETRYYDSEGESVSDPGGAKPFQAKDGTIQYSPSLYPLTAIEGAAVAEMSVPLAALDGNIRLSFGNNLFDLLNPTRSTAPYLPSGAITLGRNRIAAPSNPFSYNLRPFIEWNESNTLGEEVGLGDYTLRMEAFTLDGSEYVPASPLTLSYHKATAPKMKIANARVSESEVVPILTEESLTARAGLTFSLSKAASVSVLLYKTGEAAPVQQIAQSVPFAGGYGRVIDLLGAELKAGKVSLAEGSQYYFRITAVSSSDPTDVCTVSPYENSCYDTGAGPAPKLEFRIGRVFGNAHFWDGSDGYPFVLVSRPETPEPPDLARPQVVTPVSDVAWHVEDLQGDVFPPVEVRYKVRKKGERKRYYLGYDLVVEDHLDGSGRSQTQWNYINEIAMDDFWENGGDESRFLRLAVKKDWGDGKTMSFLGPSVWVNDAQQLPLSMDAIRNGGSDEDRDDAAGGDWVGNCLTLTKGHCYDVEPNPALEFHSNGIFRGIVPEYDHALTPWDVSILYRQDTELDGFLQAGHWNRDFLAGSVNRRYSEAEFRFSFDDFMHLHIRTLLHLKITRGTFSHVEYIDPGSTGRHPILPGGREFFDLAGISSLRHSRYEDPATVSNKFTDFADANAYIYTHRRVGEVRENRANNPYEHDGWYANQHGSGQPGSADIVDSRDYFRFHGRFVFRGEDGGDIPIPIDDIIHLDNREALLGSGGSTDEPLRIFEKTRSVVPELGECGGEITYSLWWTEDTKPYKLMLAWTPNGSCPTPAEKIAVSSAQSMIIKVSPSNVQTSPAFGSQVTVAPYASYLPLNPARTGEAPANHDGLVNQLVQTQLQGYTPVDWDANKAFDVFDIEAFMPDGSRINPANVTIAPVFSRSPDNILSFRIQAASSMREDLAGKPWGSFVKSVFGGPVIFDSWRVEGLRNGYCQQITNTGACTDLPPGSPNLTYSLYQRNGSPLEANKDIRLSRLKVVLLDQAGEEHPQVKLQSEDWDRSPDGRGFLLKDLDLGHSSTPLKLSVVPGISTPRRFVAEKQSSLVNLDRAKYISTYFEKDSKVIRIRDIDPGDDIVPQPVEIGVAQGPIAHITKTFDGSDRSNTSLSRIDFRTFLIGRELDLLSADMRNHLLFSPFKRVTVQFQAPDPDPKYSRFLADVVSIDLREMAIKYGSRNVPPLDQMIAPAFSMYPSLLDYGAFAGKEPIVTYYLRRDEVTDASNPSRNMTVDNLSRMFAYNPSSGSLTDFTAFVTLVKRTESGVDYDFQFRACREFPGNNPNGVRETQPCNEVGFDQELANGDWDYVRLIGQPRLVEPQVQALPLAFDSGSATLAAASAAPEFQEFAYLPLFENTTAKVAVTIPPRTETVHGNISLQGSLSRTDGSGEGFDGFVVEYGYGPEGDFPTFQSLKDAHLTKTAAAAADGSFSMDIANLSAGKNVLMARIAQAGSTGPGQAEVAKGTIFYLSGAPQVALVKDHLVSNLADPTVEIGVRSPLSGDVSVDIFSESGDLLKSLPMKVEADVPTFVTWNPQELTGIASMRNLVFSATLSRSLAGVSTSSRGTLEVDYKTPDLAISSIKSEQDYMLLTAHCKDAWTGKGLETCRVEIFDLGGRLLDSRSLAPEPSESGQLSLTFANTELGELIPNHTPILIALSGSHPSGNSAYVTADGRFDLEDEPLIRPTSLTAANQDFAPAFSFPSNRSGESFWQGAPLVSPVVLSQEGQHLLSASTKALGKATASNVSQTLLDKTAPRLSVSGLPPDGSILQSPVQIRASFNDPYLVSGTLSVESDGGSDLLSMRNLDDVLTYDVASPGAYKVRFEGKDLAGNLTVRQGNFILVGGLAAITAGFAQNAFLPVVNGMIELPWSVDEANPDFAKNADVSLAGIPQPVAYTGFQGRTGTVSRFLTRVPVDAAFTGSGSAVFTVNVPGKPAITLTRAFRVDQAAPILVSINPGDNSQVQRTFPFRAVIHSSVGLAQAEIRFGGGAIISSASLNGENDKTLSGSATYPGGTLQFTLEISARDILGRTLNRTIHCSVFDFQVMLRDNALTDPVIARPQIKLINSSQQTLSGFTVRLWLSRQEAPWADVAVDPYVKNPCGILVRMHTYDLNPNQMLLDFTYPAGYSLPPGGQTPEDGLQAGVHYLARNGTAWNRSNDWSWQGVSGAFQATPYVTLYDQAGRLIYGEEPDAQSVPQPPAQPAPSAYPRLMTSLQAFYLFQEGYGSIASDISPSGIPLDLDILGINAKWIPTGGLDLTTVNHNAILQNRAPNRKLFAAPTASGRVAIEAWIEPSDLVQDNARIAEFGSATGGSDVSWAMVQRAKNLEFRLRTATGPLMVLSSAGNPLASANTRYHVVMTYKPYASTTGEGGMRIYVNGKLAASNQESGALNATGTNAWIANHTLVLGNRAVALDRDWQGKLNLFAVYSRDLTMADVTRNFSAGVVEPAWIGSYRLGLACQDRILPRDILDGYRNWKEDKTADNRTLAMGGVNYPFGFGGQPQSNGALAWMAYDLASESNRLGVAGQALRLTGFAGKQDGAGTTNVFVKTSANASQPSDNEWASNSGGVVQRVFATDATNVPLDLDLRYSKWLLVGTGSAQTGTNLHGVFGGMKIRFGTVPDPVFAPKVVYRYYEIPSASQLPAFDGLTPVKSGFLDKFDLSPKLRADGFAFEYAGFVYVAAAGTYTFYTNSDDGSRLYLDGKLLVDNDGTHAAQERSGSTALTAGYHPIKVQYYDNGGSELLEVKYQGPGISKKIVPVEALFHPDDLDYGVEAKYYEGSWNTLPTFEAMAPAKTDFRSNFLITPHTLPDGFGFAFDASFFAPVAGDYTFFTNSDDGSQLFIDGRMVVQNDGIHAMQERSGQINLANGYHSIRATYFDLNGGEGLDVKFQGPGIAKSAIPVELLFAAGSPIPNSAPSGKSGAIVMGGQSLDRNYALSGVQWFKIPLATYANDWAGRIFVSLDAVDGRQMVGTLTFERGADQAVDGWYKSFVTSYTHQSELYFYLTVPEQRSYKVRWWFEP